LRTLGSFQPTLYFHDGEGMTCFIIVAQNLEELRSAARQVLCQQEPPPVAYALVFDSAAETSEGQIAMLVIETADASDEEAQVLAQAYSLHGHPVASGMTRLGAGPNLLK
jgi:hypothetical protein